MLRRCRPGSGITPVEGVQAPTITVFETPITSTTHPAVRIAAVMAKPVMT
jgi:hypothetical protein